MDKAWEVCFSVFLDRDHKVSDSNMMYLTTIVQAFQPDHAQAMIEAQYNGCAKVWSVSPK